MGLLSSPQLDAYYSLPRRAATPPACAAPLSFGAAVLAQPHPWPLWPSVASSRRGIGARHLGSARVPVVLVQLLEARMHVAQYVRIAHSRFEKQRPEANWPCCLTDSSALVTPDDCLMENTNIIGGEAECTIWSSPAAG
jgi:hypothetical protein